MACDETRHFCHDYPRLIRRWRAVARDTGLIIKKFAEADGHPLYALGPGRRQPVRDGWYLSAGIHGDEPAATEGLIDWAESHTAALATLPVRIFPCLNPWGLAGNLRCDGEGRDLNRCFDRHRMPPQLEAWAALIAGDSYRMTLHLHEDYDAQGIYVHETTTQRPPAWIVDPFFQAAARVISPDPRPKIEGRTFRNGIMQRRLTPDLWKWGSPEAFYLADRHGCHAITFETPSEFSLTRRVAAQSAFLDAAFEWVRA